MCPPVASTEFTSFNSPPPNHPSFPSESNMDSSMGSAMEEYIPEQTQQLILCATCGTAIPPNPTNMCVQCIRSTVDITEGIPKQATIYFCRGCDRYLTPPNIWIKCELESRELLALCLKRLKGLAKVRLVDASFIWTEPHSKRVKVKLTIQKEVFTSAILQQVFVVEYIVAGQYCEECTRVDAQLTWKAVIQIRQKVPHKRTFLWLEQLILKHNAHKDTTNIKEFRDGLDFYYVQRSHAIKMADFLTSVVPCRMKTSEQLISQDKKSGGCDNYKFTYSIEISPICRDELVCLPTRLAASLSNISPLVLVSRVSNTITFLDPAALQTAECRATQYWDNEFSSLLDIKSAVEYYVVDVQLERVESGKYALAIVEVARSNDLSRTYFARSHLGRILKPGDHALGYDLTNVNFNSTAWETYKSRNKVGIPDVMLIKKSYPAARKRMRARAWRVKGLVKEEELEASRGGRGDGTSREEDQEMFYRELEEDPELRGMVNLYAAPAGNVQPDGDSNAMMVEEAEEDGDDEDEPEEDFPTIQLDELLEDFEVMNIAEMEEV